MPISSATSRVSGEPEVASGGVRHSELNRWWAVGVPLVTPFVRLLFRIRVEGIERVPLRGPAILAFNHVSMLDGPLLAFETAKRLRRETRFLVAAEFFSKRLVGWILRRYEQIPIHRGEGDAAALDEAIATVREGALAGIAPEGRINDEGVDALQRIRGGVARIALPTGAPVIPVGVWGTQRRYPQTGLHFRRPWRTRIVLAFGGPILPTGDPDDPRTVEILTERLRERLEEQVSRARELAG